MAARTQAVEAVDTRTGEIVPYTGPAVTLFGTDDPNEVVVEATRHANALAEVVQSRRLFTDIQGKKHVHVDGWTLLGSMTGVFPVEEGEAEPIEVDGVKGFKATVTARTRSGQVVGRATAYCMRDEDRWRGAKLHALASMAQTRATSKALKGPLGFIVKLAGFEPTPAEEMTDQDQAAPATTNAKPTQAQQKKIHALRSKLVKAEAFTDEQFQTGLYQSYGVTSTGELTKADASDLIERLSEKEKELG